MSRNHHLNQNVKINENVPVNDIPKGTTSNTWRLNLVATFFNYNCNRLIEFWYTASKNPNFKKYVILLTISVLFILCIIISFSLFSDDEDKNVKLKDIKLCLEDVTVSYENSKNIDALKKCKAVNKPIEAKTKICFVMGASEFFDCIIRGKTYCDEHLRKETEIHIYDYGLKDIYFNYIIRDQPEFYIYEGRSLSCSFDENFLTETHESIIIIGIPQCNNFGRFRKINKNKFHEFLSEFVNCFESSGLLTDNYKIEFHESCKNFLFSKKTLQAYGNKIVFSDDDQIMNVDYYFNSSTSVPPW